jgi:hypothetical protein
MSQPEMREVDPIEVIAEVIGGGDYNYEQRDQARSVVSAIRTNLALRRALWLALTTDNPLSRLSKAPSSPASETEPLAGSRVDQAMQPESQSRRASMGWEP